MNNRKILVCRFAGVCNQKCLKCPHLPELRIIDIDDLTVLPDTNDCVVCG